MAEVTKATPPFKVVIAGGSLVGLTIALALERAGIDYVLLEKQEIAPSQGASISIHPHVQRVMEQLGVWPEIKAGVVPLEHRQHFDEYGRMFENSEILQEISKLSMNRWTVFMERKFWLKCLYNQIQDKSKVRAHCGVSSFVETSEAVEVTTDGGETIRGDLLVGADGIHSTVRTLLAEQLLASGAGDAAAAAKTAQQMREGFVATYHCIFATSRNARSSKGDGDGDAESDPTTAKGSPFLPDGTVHNVYYRGFSGVAAAGVPGLVFWFLFIKSDQVTHTPNSPRYTEEETLAAMKKYGQHALGPGYTFQDLWDSRVKAAMVPLEEGVLAPSWHSATGGRVVLVGDAVHKATVNPGLGGQLAVEGAVNFVNEIVPLVRRCAAAEAAEGASHGRKPTKDELDTALAEYEKKQRPHAKLIVSMSGWITRYESMDTWWLRLLQWVSPWISDRTKAGGFARYIKEGPWLNFLPNPDDNKKTGSS